MSAIKSHSKPMPIVTSARDLLEQRNLLGTRALRCFRGGEFNGLAFYKILEDGSLLQPGSVEEVLLAVLIAFQESKGPVRARKGGSPS
jgi:hypothetical protein